jgi:multisubunit Na+/H+ antiporter MnhB subunit
MHGMTPIVKTVSRGMAGMIFLFGVYTMLHGHLAPGGGFDAGVIMAAAFVLVVLANGSQETVSQAKRSRSLSALSLGILCFWCLAAIGLIGGIFFHNFVAKGMPFHLFSSGFIPLCNMAIGIEVAAGLFLVFLTLAILKTRGEK